jgi:hypothetical protein
MYTLASGSFRLAVGLDLDRLVLVSWCRLAASNRGRDRTGNTMHARLTFVWLLQLNACVYTDLT